jgi:hypothetical protein
MEGAAEPNAIGTIERGDRSVDSRHYSSRSRVKVKHWFSGALSPITRKRAPKEEI